MASGLISSAQNGHKRPPRFSTNRLVGDNGPEKPTMMRAIGPRSSPITSHIHALLFLLAATKAVPIAQMIQLTTYNMCTSLPRHVAHCPNYPTTNARTKVTAIMPLQPINGGREFRRVVGIEHQLRIAVNLAQTHALDDAAAEKHKGAKGLPVACVAGKPPRCGVTSRCSRPFRFG